MRHLESRQILSTGRLIFVSLAVAYHRLPLGYHISYTALTPMARFESSPFITSKSLISRLVTAYRSQCPRLPIV